MNLNTVYNSPVVKNLIANFCGLAVSLLSQIVLVPFYILYWGNQLYSDWIVLSALTVFFGMSDIGLNTVMHNLFVIQKAKGNDDECNRLIVSNFAIVTLMFIVSIAISSLYLFFFDIKVQMGIHVLSTKDANVVFLLLITQVFLKMFVGIENSIFRAVHQAHKAIYIDQIANILIVVITFIVLLFQISVPLMCFLICLPNLMSLFVKHILSKKYYTYSFSFSYVDLKQVRYLLLPSVSFLSIPLSNAIVLQGFTIVVNKFFGADATVLYNTTRTMCNFIKQVLNQINYSTSPEYSIAYGERNLIRMKKLFSKTLILSVVVIFIVILIILLAGPVIYDIWTKGYIAFDYQLMMSFLVVVLLETFWMPSREVVISTNNHMWMCRNFLISSTLSLGLAFAMCVLGLPLYLITYSQVVIHLLTGIPTIRICSHIINGYIK